MGRENQSFGARCIHPPGVIRHAVSTATPRRVVQDRRERHREPEKGESPTRYAAGVAEGLSTSELTDLLDRADVRRHLAAGADGTTGLTVEYRVEPDGPSWWWSTRDATVATGIGSSSDPDVVLVCSARTARQLIDGTVEVSRAFLLGELRAEGNLGAALDLASGHRAGAEPSSRGPG